MKFVSSSAQRISKTVALGVLLLAPFGGEARGAAAADHAWFPDPIEGVWNASVEVTNCATGATIAGLEAMGMFAANGTLHNTDTNNPALGSASFGHWRHVEGNEYQFAFRHFRFDAAGAHIGSQIVRHDVFLAADGASYFSEGTSEFFDTPGNLLFIACSSATATRFE
jgi:hypothetical protein